MKNIALIFGGKSVEHDVSIITAKQIHNGLFESEYTIFPVYMDLTGKFYYIKDFCIKNFVNFKPKKYKEIVFVSNKKAIFYKSCLGIKKLSDIDVCILGTHGGNGENGTLQGFLDTLNLPYTSSGPLSCGVAMDKVFMKDIFINNNIKTPHYIYFNENDLKISEAVKTTLSNFEFPIVVKPANLGSSIGISICKNKTQLKNALELANLYDRKIIVEECINNLKEVNISAFLYKGEILLSNTEQPTSAKEFLSYEKKYLESSKTKAKGMASQKRKMPADLNQEQSKKVSEYAKKAYQIFDCKGIVRIDFLIDEKSGEVYINEINTIPGSLSFYLWKDSFKSLLEKLIDESLSDNKKEKNIILKSKILSNYID